MPELPGVVRKVDLAHLGRLASLAADRKSDRCHPVPRPMAVASAAPGVGRWASSRAPYPVRDLDCRWAVDRGYPWVAVDAPEPPDAPGQFREPQRRVVRRERARQGAPVVSQVRQDAEALADSVECRAAPER